MDKFLDKGDSWRMNRLDEIIESIADTMAAMNIPLMNRSLVHGLLEKNKEMIKEWLKKNRKLLKNYLTETTRT